MLKAKRIICLCQTYYQLIVAVQIKRELFPHDEVTLVLTDTSNGAKTVVENLNKLDLFEHAYLAESVREDNRRFSGVKEKANRFYQYFFSGDLTSFLPKKKYDLMLGFNYGWYAYILFTKLYKWNRHIKVAKFEEGLISYYVGEGEELKQKYFKAVSAIKKILHQPLVIDGLKDFYCFHPDLYPGQLQPQKIPLLKTGNQEIKNIFSEIFSVDISKLSYPQKYIFFASVLDQVVEKGLEGELDVIESVANVVGKENLLVKLHPRESHIEAYRERGLLIDRNSDIPFEVIQLLYDFSDHVFLTTASGSVINLTSITDKGAKVYFAYHLFGRRNDRIQKICNMYEDLILQMHNHGMVENVYVFSNKEDMKKQLEQPSSPV